MAQSASTSLQNLSSSKSRLVTVYRCMAVSHLSANTGFDLAWHTKLQKVYRSCHFSYQPASYLPASAWAWHGIQSSNKATDGDHNKVVMPFRKRGLQQADITLTSKYWCRPSCVHPPPTTKLSCHLLRFCQALTRLTLL